MKIILKQIYFLIFIFVLAFPQGVFAVSDREAGAVSAPSYSVVSVTVGAQIQSVVEVTNSLAEKQPAITGGSIACAGAFSSGPGGFSLQEAGFINFNQPANCFSLSVSRQAQTLVPLAVSAQSFTQTKVLVVRDSFFSKIYSAPVLPKAGAAIPAITLALAVLAASALATVLAVGGLKRPGPLTYYNKEVSLHYISVMRC